MKSQTVAMLVSGIVFCCLSVPTLAKDNVIIVLDNSGSMNGVMPSGQKKMAAAKSGLNTVLAKLPPDSNVGLIVFQKGALGSHWVKELGPVNLADAKRKVSAIKAGGGTPLGQFMKIGADVLLEARKNERFGNYRLLVVTDGEANDPELVKKFLPDILSRGIVVDVIGVAMARTHSLATQVHSYRRADDKRSLERAIQQVLAESVTNERGEVDYSLLDAIPDDVGIAMITALTEAGSRNEPIR